MPSHLIVFIASLSFLSGVVFAGIGLSFIFAFVPAALVFAYTYWSRAPINHAIAFALILLAGHFVYSWDDYRYWHTVSRLPQEIELQGVISHDPRISPDRLQILTLHTGQGDFRIVSKSREKYQYGDVLKVQGEIEKPTESDTYLIKEKIVGTFEDPSFVRIATGEGNAVVSFFLAIKKSIRESFQSLLAPNQAAFLSGTVLGVNDDFSQDFLNELSTSGTRHLTAVSGQHIAIIFAIFFALFSRFLSRKSTFLATASGVVLFVGLTGLQASVIRAALMGMLAGLARQTGRVYAPHNSIVLAAVILTLLNPKVLLFDIGFQLSFLAVLAIIYAEPAVRRLLHLEGSGFLGWKDSFVMTLCAQAGTAPLLMTQFQNFSFMSLAANVLILGVIPLIMVLGFLIALFSYIFAPLAIALSMLIAPFIDYVTLVIHVFAQVSFGFNPQFGLIGSMLYYGCAIGFLYLFWRREKCLLRTSYD